MNVALMNLRITFQRNEVVIDTIGNHKNTWTDYYSCYATIGSENGSETQAAGQTTAQSTAAFTVRYCDKTSVISPDGYRIIYNNELYNITHIDHLSNKRKALKFWVEKVKR